MTDEWIFTRAIQKAIDGGWDLLRGGEVIEAPGGLFARDSAGIKYSVNDVIFNHDFAKHLWGDDEYIACKGCKRYHYDDTDMNDNIPPFKYHLQQIVTADNKIKYLGENI